MALLTAELAKELVPKSRGLSDEAIQLYLDAAEERIEHQIGAPNGDAITRVEMVYHRRNLVLGRPLRNGAKTDVTSVEVVKATARTIDADSWYLLDEFTLWREACWPYDGPIKVVYNAVSMETEAKEAQAQLVAIALISDGIASVEDGEFIERRLQGSGNTSDMIAKANRRILSRLLRGPDMV